MTDLAGQYLGRYYLMERLGEGGMATVYKGYDTRLERDVAVKIIRSAAFPVEALDSVLKRFEREAKSLAKLSHPNIVKVYDYGEHDGSPYLVMEYLPGGTLKKFIGKPMNWQEALRLLLPIARGVAYAHQRGILHRDIKPANILITEDGDPMLSDFGIAKLFEGEQTTALTGSGMAIGTPEYMAPEQWTGITSPQSDLYSLGIVLYELLAGRKPYMGDTPAAILIKQATEPLPSPRKFVSDLPEALELVLIKVLAKDPADRYTDGNAFIRALENFRTSVSVLHPPEAKVAEETPNAPSPQLDIPFPTQAVPPVEEDVHAIEESPSSIIPDTPMPPTDAVDIPPQAPETEAISARISNQSAERTVKTFEPLPSQAREETVFHPVPVTKKATPLKLSPKGIGFLVGGIFIVLAIWLGSPLIGAWFSQAPVATEQLTVTPASMTQTPTKTKVASEDPFDVIPTNTASPTPFPFPTEITDDKNVQMVLVPEGVFTMGSYDGQANEQPEHSVYLTAYYIDKYEVTNALYKECVDAGMCDRPTNTTKYNSSQYAQHPVTWVYWDMAKEYCEWRGARLPTEGEWEKAARGTDERAYPWGKGLNKTFANYGNNVGDTTAVGSYPQGVSPYGAYDMAGNVEEWVADWYGENYYAISPKSNPTGPESGDYHLLRGGSWKFGHSISTTFRNMYLRQYPENYYFGVRCALSAHLAIPNSEFTATQLTPPSQTVTAPLTPTSQFLACDQKSTKMEYVADVTIPDGTEMNPGQVFLKTWKIRNAGSCSWDEGYKLIYQFGDEMLGKSSPLLGVVMPGQEVDVSVQFTAPMTKGEYTSLWIMANAEGVSFGDALYVQIVVK